MSKSPKRKTPPFGHDVTCHWCRKYLCCMYRAGYKKELKTDINRWERHSARLSIRKADYDAL